MVEEILVYAEIQEGKLARPTWEAVAAAQQLAGDSGTTCAAVIVGDNVSDLAGELAGAGLQEVLAVESPQLSQYTPDGWSMALRQVIEKRQPRYAVFSHTYEVRDFAPRLAASLDRGLIGDALGYRREGERTLFVRQVFQGKFSADVEFRGEPPYFVSFQSGAFREDAVQRGQSQAKVTPVEISIPQEAIRTSPQEKFREAKQAVDLGQAEIIVAVGRGIKKPENMELAQKLAEALGAEIGASRPICDSGWLPMDRQIGSSGQTVAPKLYVALGISGAIQHQVGMKGSRTVVAINKDREAPIFDIATYGIAGDLFEVVPPLIEEIR
ncbi:MAG TPA: electron transfer flavoprotein subunit alpha/FixB family protein, partial [Terriglobia bacterium]|nr:electron transfer flavoprotein subunit alpha/FixB family protein [Terriglobia bacterium]